jgi:hypothetical protein
MGRERLSGPLKTSSALPFKADLEDQPAIGRFVPQAGMPTICSSRIHRRVTLNSTSATYL